MDVRGGVLVSNTEFVQTISGLSSNYGMYGTHLANPGQSDMFPWLAGIASRYEKFRFRKLSIKYKPTCSTSIGGYVMLGVDYDAVDVPPSTRQVMSSYEGTVETAPWKETTMNVKCGNQLLYVMVGS